MKSFADDKIDVYLRPTELGAADNLEQAIVDFIGGARKSLDIAVQEIDSIPIAEAIINARWTFLTWMGWAYGGKGRSAMLTALSETGGAPASLRICVPGLQSDGGVPVLHSIGLVDRAVWNSPPTSPPSRTMFNCE